MLHVGPCWSRPVGFSMATASGSVSAVLLQPWLASGVMERHLSVPEAFPWILECAEMWACTAVPKAWKGVPDAVVSFLRGIRLGPDLAPALRSPAPLEDAAAAAAPAQAPADPAADPLVDTDGADRATAVLSPGECTPCTPAQATDLADALAAAVDEVLD